MEKVYVLVAVWENGLKFEGETSAKVFANKELAYSALVAYTNDALKFFERCYSKDDISTERTIGRAEVYANDYDDCWTGWVEEQTVIGER
jgi:hypothetical protein